MAKDVAKRAESELHICAVPLEYPPDRGTFLKDAAVLAGMGAIGKPAARRAGTHVRVTESECCDDFQSNFKIQVIGNNNLLITPQYGPRVRLSALALEIELSPTECRTDFDPCSLCEMPCLKSCPQAAFPANRYDRPMCEIQMRLDESSPLKSSDANGYCVSYCRKCELVCPIGETEAAETAEQPHATDADKPRR